MKRVRQAASNDRPIHKTTAAPQHCAPATRSDRARGEPLPPQVRTVMEPRFAHDFAQVRIHADARADSMAQALDARAVTVDQDVYFRDAAFDPTEPASVHLLAHELAHVAQNANAGGAESGLSERSDASEHNARAAANAALAGGPVSVGGAAPAAVARDEGGPEKEYESPFERAGALGEAPKAIGGLEIPGMEGLTSWLGMTAGLDKAAHADSAAGLASATLSTAGGMANLAGTVGQGVGALSEETGGALGGVGGLWSAGSSAIDAVSDFSKGNYGKGALDTAKAGGGALSGLGGIGGFSIAESGGMEAGAALSGEGLEGLAALGPAGAVIGAGLAGAGIGTELYNHTSVGEHSQGALGTLDSWLSEDGKTPWSERTLDAMSDDFSKGNMSSLSGVGNYAKGIGNAAELGLFGLGGAVGGLAGGAVDAGKWVGGKVGDAASAVGGGISDAASWAGGEISGAASAVGGGISDAASAVGGGISDAASAVWDWL